MPIIGADLVLAGNPRFRIFSTISIGYGSVDRSDSSTDTSTSTSRLALVDRVLSAVRAPSAPYPPATYSEILAPACTGGRSGSLLLTQPDAACTVNGVASRSCNGPFCPKSVMRTTTRSGLSILNESASSPERSSVPGGSASTRRCARDQSAGDRRITLEIDCGAAFSGVEVLEQTTPMWIRNAAGKRSPVAQRIAGRRLDLGDLGTEVDEQLGEI